MNVLLALFFLNLPSLAADINCPQQQVSCKLKKLSEEKHYFETIKTLDASFEAFNWDEPSLPPNTCQISGRFDEKVTGGDFTFNVTVKEDLETFLYIGKDYGALSPQSYFTPELGKPFTMTYKNFQMECTLK